QHKSSGTIGKRVDLARKPSRLLLSSPTYTQGLSASGAPVLVSPSVSRERWRQSHVCDRAPLRGGRQGALRGSDEKGWRQLVAAAPRVAWVRRLLLDRRRWWRADLGRAFRELGAGARVDAACRTVGAGAEARR